MNTYSNQNSSFVDTTLDLLPKILIVEDDSCLRENLQDVLNNEGFVTCVAENGVQALQLLLMELPDLILCDVMMPDLDGYKVLEMIRSHGDIASIPFIFLTGKAALDDFRQGMELGADDYLLKPFQSSQLLKAVKTQLKKRKLVTRAYQTKLQELEHQLDYFRYYDPLTNLPNFVLLKQQYEQAIARLQEQPNHSPWLPVLVISLDGFADLRDRLGREATHFLLKAVAQRLNACTRSIGVSGYSSENQFITILTNGYQEEDAVHVAEVILSSLNQPFQIDLEEVLGTVSIGIKLVNYEENLTLVEILDQAKFAQECAVKKGGNCYYFCQQIDLPKSIDSLSITKDLGTAVGENELRVYYQPQISLQTGEIVGVEALLRWLHPERGLLLPYQFLPLAEDLGLIMSFDEWVLKTASDRLATWSKQFSRPLQLAVNTSVSQLNHPKFDRRLQQIIEKTDFNPEFLTVEITESFLVENYQELCQKLENLRAIGIKIALDDFGTGYASLKHLQNIPCDILKIDKSFVHNLDKNPTNAAIVISLLKLAESLNYKTIVEGVETQEELNFLRQQANLDIQGYLFSPPVPEEELIKFLQTGKRLIVSSE